MAKLTALRQSRVLQHQAGLELEAIDGQISAVQAKLDALEPLEGRIKKQEVILAEAADRVQRNRVHAANAQRSLDNALEHHGVVSKRIELLKRELAASRLPTGAGPCSGGHAYDALRCTSNALWGVVKALREAGAPLDPQWQQGVETLLNANFLALQSGAPAPATPPARPAAAARSSPARLVTPAELPPVPSDGYDFQMEEPLADSEGLEAEPLRRAAPVLTGCERAMDGPPTPLASPSRAPAAASPAATTPAAVEVIQSSPEQPPGFFGTCRTWTGERMYPQRSLFDLSRPPLLVSRKAAGSMCHAPARRARSKSTMAAYGGQVRPLVSRPQPGETSSEASAAPSRASRRSRSHQADSDPAESIADAAEGWTNPFSA